MSSRKDPLFRIFEQHLYNAMVEDETTDDFLGRVVSEYTKSLSSQGTIPHEHRETLAQDLREEVLEMLRKKTYGHFSLNEFRKKKVAPVTQDGTSATSSRDASGPVAPTASGAARTRKSTFSHRQRRSS